MGIPEYFGAKLSKRSKRPGPGHIYVAGCIRSLNLK